MADPLSQLHAAVRTMDVEAVAAALQAGANASAAMAAPLPWTPLHHAALLGSLRATQLLLAAGADPGAVASVRLARGEPGFPAGGVAPEALFEGATPLHLASMTASADVAAALLAAAPIVALRRVAVHLVRLAGADEEEESPEGVAPPPAGAASTARSTLELSLLRGSLAATLRMLAAVPAPLLRPLVEQVPPPCPQLGPTLAVLLTRCPAAAGAAAARLPAADRQRLRTALLCLERLQRARRCRLPRKFVAAALSLALAP